MNPSKAEALRSPVGCPMCLPSLLLLWEMPPGLGQGRAALTGRDPCHQGRAPTQAGGLLVQTARTPGGPSLPETGLLLARTQPGNFPVSVQANCASTPCLSSAPFRPSPGPSLDGFCSSGGTQSQAQPPSSPWKHLVHRWSTQPPSDAGSAVLLKSHKQNQGSDEASCRKETYFTVCYLAFCQLT